MQNNNSDNYNAPRQGYGNSGNGSYQPIFKGSQQPQPDNQLPLGYGTAPEQFQGGQQQNQAPYYSPYQSDAAPSPQDNGAYQQQPMYGGEQYQNQVPYGYQQGVPYQDGSFQNPQYGTSPYQYQGTPEQQFGGYVDSSYSAGYSQNYFSPQPGQYGQQPGQGAGFQFTPQGQGNDYSANDYPPQQERQSKFPFHLSENAVILIVGLVLLPLLFILSVSISGASALGWIYVTLAVICMVLLWIRPNDNPNQRLTLTVVHGVMCIISLVMLLTSSPADKVNKQSDAQQNQSLAQNMGYTAENANSEAPMGFVPAEETAAPTENPQSGATAEALNSFLYLWTTNNQSAMLTYCSPNWVKSQEKPEVSLFSIIANRLPTSYTIEKISGTEADISRTATVTAAIVRQNSTASEEKYRYQIIMTQENGSWYVDPSSLKSNEKAETAAPTVESVATPVPSTAIDPNTKLYYNADGGKLYHIDPDCPSIDKKYRPLTAYFTYSQIYDSQYSTLTKCARCGAPKRQPKSD